MNNLLLPYRWKFVGIVLAFFGIVSAILYSWFDLKFKMQVFAVYSSFLDTKYFVSFRTNFADELTLLLLICGLSLIIFSKEKDEFDGLDSLRFKALAKALILNIIFLLFAVLFVYGSGFIAMLVINIFTFLVCYLLFFYLQKSSLKER